MEASQTQTVCCRLTTTPFCGDTLIFLITLEAKWHLV